MGKVGGKAIGTGMKCEESVVAVADKRKGGLTVKGTERKGIRGRGQRGRGERVKGNGEIGSREKV